MAITSITITQDNIVSGSDLLPVHSPLVFLVDSEFTGAVPDYISVDLFDENGTLLNTYAAYPYSDLTLTKRQFYFISDEILRSKMQSFDDFVQAGASLVYVNRITKVFTLTFYDPSTPTTNDSVTFTAIHASGQFGSNPNMTNIYNNTAENYIAIKNKPVYVYFYNNDTTRTLTVTVT